MAEAPYTFRTYLETVHHADARNPDATPGPDETVIDDGWQIAVHPGAPALVGNVALDNGGTAPPDAQPGPASWRELAAVEGPVILCFGLVRSGWKLKA